MPARETPATRAARDAGVAFELHEYEHDPRADSYALEAATALDLDPDLLEIELKPDDLVALTGAEVKPLT